MMTAVRLPTLLVSLLLLLGTGASAGSVSAVGAPHVMHLASLEWLPYVGPGLAGDGLSGTIAATAARQFGYTVRVDYFPWKRAMQMGGEEAGYAGYFPAYYTPQRARSCYFSAPMGNSTVGLAYLKSEPLRWEHLSDLGGMRIGVVTGYSNGKEFDALAEQGKLQLDASPGDAINLRKLLAGRVKAVVIDKSVLRYLLLTDSMLVADRERIAFHPNVLAELTLHACFQRTPAGLQLQKKFDEALSHMDIVKIENSYFQDLENKNPGELK
jgi:polar amino acid transport system substrate-binding protein